MGGDKMLDSASAHAMIGVKDLSRANEFYSDKLGLTVADEFPQVLSAMRRAAGRGSWSTNLSSPGRQRPRA
jgi:catechol 2,3-dioxygenase-like lactoylglutathione lyase family enzyme